MPDLPPWASGPFELIRHAQGHLHAGSDFDRRMALISFDNAVETSITTYLQLNPTLRGGQTYRKDDVQQWLANYHTKLDFLKLYIAENGIGLEPNVSEIIWYHTLRNEMYHSGNGMVPELSHVYGARSAALAVFSILYNLDAELLLDAPLDTVQEKRIESEADTLSSQARFLQEYVRLEHDLRVALEEMDGCIEKRASRLEDMWVRFCQHAEIPHPSEGFEVPKRYLLLPDDYSIRIHYAMMIRDGLAHQGLSRTSDANLNELTDQIAELSEFVQKYPSSDNILGLLRKNLGDEIRSDLRSVRIVQKNATVFLECTYWPNRSQSHDNNQTVLSDLSVFGDEEFWLEDKSGKVDLVAPPSFMTNTTAWTNADLFIEYVDLDFILNGGLGESLLAE